MRHRRSSWLLLFSASGLIAGWNDVKMAPVFPDFDSLGRNAYPRNVNETHGTRASDYYPHSIRSWFYQDAAATRRFPTDQPTPPTPAGPDGLSHSARPRHQRTARTQRSGTRAPTINQTRSEGTD